MNRVSIPVVGERNGIQCNIGKLVICDEMADIMADVLSNGLGLRVVGSWENRIPSGRPVLVSVSIVGQPASRKD